MVGITIECRLGNQLFQYAFIKALSKKLNAPFFMNDKFEKFIVPDYFDLEESSTLINRAKKMYFKLRHGLFHRLQSVPVDTYNDAIFESLTDNIIYSGYFQSELFFKNIADKIPSYIRVNEKHKKKFTEKYQDVFTVNPVISVHLRRGDYLNLNDWWAENYGSNDLTLPVSYYLHCLEQINNIQDYKIIFVSDDIEFARTVFSHIKNADFSDNDMMTDFQIILNSDICIISNSSFAWWAAYLNRKEKKKVFCPEYWLGFKVEKEYPLNIIPPNWIQVEVSSVKHVNGIN
jgi:hypothetical protein